MKKQTGVKEEKVISIYLYFTFDWVNPHQDDETINGLTLIRDVQAGKNVYFMQVTKGDATSALARVNAKLKKNG